MQKIHKLILLALLFVCPFASAQFPPKVLQSPLRMDLMSLHYRNRINDSKTYFLDSKINHSSVLPAIQFKSSDHTEGALNFRRSSGKLEVKMYPLTDLSIGADLHSASGNRFLYTGGAGLGLNLISGSFFFTAKMLPYATESGYVRDSIQNKLNMDPGASRAIFPNGFAQNEFLLAYQPNQFFTFLTGNGKNFFGEGYRSLILSDNALATPFFKIETSFSNVKYVNLYQMWLDNTVDPALKSLDKKKFAAMHYISWNITREFNVSIFESVVWQSNDTLINRGFDVSYLNPIVFYRPVEYGNGSADNVLLGANMSFKFDSKQSVYSQLILDDFLLAEIRARSRWWANKYGFQFGYKSREFLGKKNLYFQTEFNVVRPFTYSHKNSGQSYGHLNASVSHPIGANFFEILALASYPYKKLRFTNKITYSAYGVDSSAVSYGQNIFVSYNNRVGDYDHLIMQGARKNVLNETLIIERPLLAKIDLYANFTYNWRMEITETRVDHSHYFSVGIRSRIWNRYSDF